VHFTPLPPASALRTEVRGGVSSLFTELGDTLNGFDARSLAREFRELLTKLGVYTGRWRLSRDWENIRFGIVDLVLNG
jgi:hypothetical protein